MYINKPRLKLAAMFLYEVIVPGLKAKSITSLEDIKNALPDFRDSHPMSGNDFELDHVWGLATKRVAYYDVLAKNDDTLPKDAFWIHKAWTLLSEEDEVI